MTDSFSLDAYTGKLEELQTKLGELKGIELALDGLPTAAIDYEHQHGLKDGTYGASQPVLRDFTLGTTYPFVKGVYVSAFLIDQEPDYLSQRIQQWAQEGESWAFQAVQGFAQNAHVLTAPNPSEISSIAGTLATDVAVPLAAEVPGDFAQLDLADWRGDAADSFKHFLKSIHDTAQVEGQVLGYVNKILAGGAAILRMGQHSAMNAVTAAVENVDGQLRHFQGDDIDLKEFLALAALATGLFAALPAAVVLEATTEVAVASTAVLFYAYGEIPEKDGDKKKFTATSAAGLVDEAGTELTTIVTNADKNYDHLDRTITEKLINEIDRIGSGLVFPDPGLDGPVTSLDLHNGSAPQ